ncbi:MAG: type II toxin-antitoxin system VapC family toxin [Acidithiobacillus sp.]|jgi:PIN domain nuclease of toxin-antitoxin system|nr:type II toxin-antitoxin system VapC family toxin [Acidithiobacillus sp.]
MTVAYLDTHALVWLYAGVVERFAAESQRVIETHDLLVSPMALLEVQYLCEKGVVTVTPDTLFAELAQTIGLAVCTIPFAMVTRSAFALSWTSDPFDRLIVAQAMVYGRPLVSKDRLIAQYYPHTIW